MKKIFISQGFRDKTNDEIIKERSELIEYAYNRYKNEDIEILDNYFTEENTNLKNFRLMYLGISIELLSMADIAIFAKDFKDYTGCVIENQCAHMYGIKEIVEL